MDANTEPAAEPKLAPPGAGLPPLELFIGRLLIAWARLTSTRESRNARFQREREAIRALVVRCDALVARGDVDSGARRILIARPPGLEDSSRHWSVWMTLDHLRIVNSGITRTIQSLANGTVPERTASTAAVKPSPLAGAATAAAYEQSCDTLLATVAAVPDLHTPLRYAHPWFGPLDAAGWHFIAATHMGLHRVQLERILAALQPAVV